MNINNNRHKIKEDKKNKRSMTKLLRPSSAKINSIKIKKSFNQLHTQLTAVFSNTREDNFSINNLKNSNAGSNFPVLTNKSRSRKLLKRTKTAAKIGQSPFEETCKDKN